MTYVLDDPLENFIAGRDLVAGALNREWQKAETGRSDTRTARTLSWNVFCSLQEAGQLGLAARVLAGVDVAGEPELILWGRRIGLDETARCDEIHDALDRLEPHHGQQTEPDVVMRIPGWGWIFIEAKLSSPTATYAGKEKKLEKWRQTYATPTPGLFDEAALDTAVANSFPEQLLRETSPSPTPSARRASRRSSWRWFVSATRRRSKAGAAAFWWMEPRSAWFRGPGSSCTRRSRRMMPAYRDCAATWKTRAWGYAELSRWSEGLAGRATEEPPPRHGRRQHAASRRHR